MGHWLGNYAIHGRKDQHALGCHEYVVLIGNSVKDALIITSSPPISFEFGLAKSKLEKGAY